MEVLQSLLVVLVILGLIIHAVDHVPIPLGAQVKPWISSVVAIIGALYLAQRFLL